MLLIHHSTNNANDPGSICGCAFEDAIHFILECCLYNEAREELKLRLVFFHELKIEASSNAHPHIQPGSLTKCTRKRSAFKLLDLCLGLV
jgi:hypothetical protein